jgi:hypothetical protein
VPHTPSRFLADVPKELCETREITELARIDVRQLAQKTSKALASFAPKPKF